MGTGTRLHLHKLLSSLDRLKHSQCILSFIDHLVLSHPSNNLELPALIRQRLIIVIVIVTFVLGSRYIVLVFLKHLLDKLIGATLGLLRGETIFCLLLVRTV